MVSEKEVIKKWENGGGGVVFEINFFVLSSQKSLGWKNKPIAVIKVKFFKHYYQ